MLSQCESCKYYHYYLWAYPGGHVKQVHSCLIFEDNYDTGECGLYQKKEEEQGQ